MITIFNRKELFLTRDAKVCSVITAELHANGVEYVVNPLTIEKLHCNYPADYRIYVRKKDYEYAWYLIRDKI